MAPHSPLPILKSGVDNWNRWRAQHANEPCSLANQNLSNGYYFEGDFSNVDLSGADLQRACLIGANFKNANLSNANLRHAYLDRASFEGAILIGADLTETNLKPGELKNAVLEPSQQPIQPSHRKTPSTRAARRSPFNPYFVWLPAVFVLGVATALSAIFSTASLKNATKEPTPVSAVTEVAASEQDNLTLAKTLSMASQIWAVETHIQADGDVLAVGGDIAGSIKVWNGITGEMLHTLSGHNDMVRTLALSNSGQRLVSGSGDGIKVWQPQTGELLYSISAKPGAPIWSVDISSDEQTFVSSDYAGNVALWDLTSGEQIYRCHEGMPVWAVAIAPDGKSFFSGGSDRTIRQRDLATGQLMQTFVGHEDTVRAIAISPDGKTLASGSWDSTVKLWNLTDGTLKSTLTGHSDRVVSLDISNDGKTLASSSVDSTLRLWDLPSSALIKTLDNSDGWVLSVAFAPSARMQGNTSTQSLADSSMDVQRQTLVSGGKNRMLKVWRSHLQPENQMSKKEQTMKMSSLTNMASNKL
ncbi:MAG: pentapeptide repeat-containing protein [Cyanobacteria bacterium J06649_4]